MRRLTSDIQVGRYRLVGAVEVSIESSWDALTDTCILTLPKRGVIDRRQVEIAQTDFIRRGDQVSIDLGYDFNNTRRFEGFVSEVQAGSPVKLICEDYAYLLKKDSHTISFKSVSLRSLLKQILPKSIQLNTIDVELGQFRISKASTAKVLEEVKSTYRLHSWFRGDVLYAGLAYRNLNSETKIFGFEENIIKDNLTYRRADQVEIKLTATSMLPSNKKIEIELGDDHGEARALFFYNKDRSTLELLAKEELEKLKVDGYKGKFLSFGEPVVQHGDVVKLRDKRYGRQGSYLVKKVKVDFSDKGYRQEIELDKQAL